MSNHIKSSHVLLVGTGYMAKEYVKVLKSLPCKFVVIGNQLTSTKEFERATGKKAYSGGIEKLNNFSEFTHCINAVRSDLLHSVNTHLLQFGAREILCEKPGALYLNELKQITKLANQSNTRILIAYNRRFYSSVDKLIELVKLDGGVESLYFDFTEWEAQWIHGKTSKKILLNLFIMNSLHIIDLAFYICGLPKKLSSFVSGYSDWHQKAMIFSGAGITHNDTLFSYTANWNSAGRWGIEVNSRNFKFILRPLEELQVLKKTTSSTIYTEAEKIKIDDSLDIQFKPGLYNQILAFLCNLEQEKVIDIHEHTNNVDSIYLKILNGTS